MSKHNDEERVFIVLQWQLNKAREKINGQSKTLDLTEFQKALPGYFRWAAHPDTKVGTTSATYSSFNSVGDPIKMKITRIA